MFRCRDVGQLLYEYVEGLLDPMMQRQLEQHLADCHGCIAFVNTYKRTIALSEELRYQEIPSELREKLRSFMKGKLISRRPSLWQRLRFRWS